MNFYGLGYRGKSKRWFTDVWFWCQTPSNLVDPLERLTTEEIEQMLSQRLDENSPYLNGDTHTEISRMFETLVDITDDDAALAEMQVLGLL